VWIGATILGTQARKAPEQPPPVEVGLDGAGADRTQRAGATLEALLVDPDVLTEMAIEEPAKGGVLGVARPIDRLRLAHEQRQHRGGRAPARSRPDS